jgi:hypothetical protein
METLITIADCDRTPNLPPEYETEITTKTYDVITVVVIVIADGDYRAESSTVLMRLNAVYGGTYGLHLQSGRMSQARSQSCATCVILFFFLGLFLDSEDGSDMFL